LENKAHDAEMLMLLVLKHAEDAPAEEKEVAATQVADMLEYNWLLDKVKLPAVGLCAALAWEGLFEAIVAYITAQNGGDSDREINANKFWLGFVFASSLTLFKIGITAIYYRFYPPHDEEEGEETKEEVEDEAAGKTEPQLYGNSDHIETAVITENPVATSVELKEPVKNI
jgi:hypothetical protein